MDQVKESFHRVKAVGTSVGTLWTALFVSLCCWVFVLFFVVVFVWFLLLLLFVYLFICLFVWGLLLVFDFVGFWFFVVGGVVCLLLLLWEGGVCVADLRSNICKLFA